MDFTQLQQSWQQQAAPAAASTPATEAASLLAATERLHRFGRRRNWLSTGLLVFALACFVGAQLLQGRSHTSQQWLGLGLLCLTLLGFLAAMWWGTTLRAAARPGLDSRAYLAASLRVFRFRRTALLWLGVPYALGFGLGLTLWNLPRFEAAVPSDWWLLGLGLWGRAVGLRRYEREFGSTERELVGWQLQLTTES